MGIGLMLRYRNSGSSTAQVILTQIIVGIGGGMTNVPAQLGIQASSLHQEVGAATALFLTIVSIGGAIGSAISGAVWSYNIQHKLMEYLPENAKGDVKEIVGSAVFAQTFAMGTPERIAIIKAYDETMKILLIIAVFVCLPMLPMALLMKNFKLDQIDQRVKGTVIGFSPKSPEHEVGAQDSKVNEVTVDVNGQGQVKK